MENSKIKYFFVLIALICCSVCLCACGNNNKTNISSIEIENTVYVVKIGQFDEANISATVHYEGDKADETLFLKESMIPTEFKSYLNTPGIYDIEINFKGVKASLKIKVVNSLNLYKVQFYNANNEIISTQFVYEGENAVEPTEEMKLTVGYEFLSWDVNFNNITADTKVYGVYVNIENELSQTILKEKFLSAYSLFKSTNHTATLYDIMDKSTVYTTHINYHYNQTEKASSQIYVCNQDNVFFKQEIFNNKITMLSIMDDTISYNSEPTQGSGLTEDELITQALWSGNFFEELDECFLIDDYNVNFTYNLSENKWIYYLTITIEKPATQIIDYPQINTLVCTFDDDSIISIESTSRLIFEISTMEMKYLAFIEYENVAFQQNFIPTFGDVDLDGDVDADDLTLINNYIAETQVLTQQQLNNADLFYDAQINTTDAMVMQNYLNGNITQIPVKSYNIIQQIFENLIEQEYITMQCGANAVTINNNFAISTLNSKLYYFKEVDFHLNVLYYDEGELKLEDDTKSARYAYLCPFDIFDYFGYADFWQLYENSSSLTFNNANELIILTQDETNNTIGVFNLNNLLLTSCTITSNGVPTEYTFSYGQDASTIANLFKVTDAMMSPALPENSLVVMEILNECNVGDIIVYNTDGNNVVARIVGLMGEDLDLILIVHQDDAGPTDPSSVEVTSNYIDDIDYMSRIILPETQLEEVLLNANNVEAVSVNDVVGIVKLVVIN